jgi:outer membrane PBP1 activator LpoA protein
MKHLAASTVLAAALIGLVGCGSAPPERPAEEATPIAVETPPPEPSDPVEATLLRASRSSPGERAGLLLDAADMLLARKEYARAKDVLRQSVGADGSQDQRARRAILLSEALSGTGDAAAALDVLANAAGTEDAALPRALEAGLREARARALLALGKPLEAARERTSLQPWLTAESDRASNAKHILDALGRVPLGELDAAVADAGSDDWRAWIELSVTARDMRHSPGVQRQRLQEWAQRYSGIAAFGANIPGLVEEISKGISEPARVALLLPLSGRAGSSGQAVLQGYLAGHYRALAAGETLPALAIVDTGGTPEGFSAAYRSTTADGATVVVGPLLKEELAAFRTGLTASVPTLALNFLDAPAAAISGVHQFGIDLADEVAELGSDARREQFSRAVILADASPRSRRLVDDFSARWQASGGELIDTLFLGDLNEYRLSLEQTLHLDQSHHRSESLGRVTGLELQTEPRRRADVDLIVLLAEPTGARSIRALLPFLYAGDIPARATSISYSAGSGREGDLDLESVRFLDMPWFSGSEESLRNIAVAQRGPVERLMALGVDAQRLQSRLALLGSTTAWGLAGATGELIAGADGRLHRRAVWYVVQGGQAKAELPRAGIVEVISREGAETWTTGEGTAPSTSDAEPKTAH